MLLRAASRFVLTAFALCACGGSTPPKTDTPESAPTNSAKPEPKASTDEPKEAPTSDSSSPPTPEVSKPSRPPIETITAPKVAYVINYASSRPHEVAEKKCEQLPEDKPGVREACMKRERSEFVADVIQFKKDAKDKVSWATYRRRGETLFLVHRTAVDLTGPTDNTVTVVITGDDKGPRALFAQKKKFVVQVPNDYSIELDDPFLGKLVYDAKLDIVGQK